MREDVDEVVREEATTEEERQRITSDILSASVLMKV